MISARQKKINIGEGFRKKTKKMKFVVLSNIEFNHNSVKVPENLEDKVRSTLRALPPITHKITIGPHSSQKKGENSVFCVYLEVEALPTEATRLKNLILKQHRDIFTDVVKFNK